MPNVVSSEREVTRGRGLVLSWVGLLLAPAVFFAHLQIAYVMVPWACIHHGEVWIHLVGAVAVAATAAGAWVAWRAWNEGGRDAPGDGGGTMSSARLLAVGGLSMSALLALLIAMQWVATFFISPCQ